MTTDLLRQRAKALRLYGLLAHWTEIADAPWLPTLLQWEEDEHIRRSLERRMKSARLGRFKAIDEFDWNWPTRCDRGAIEAILTLDFISEAANVILNRSKRGWEDYAGEQYRAPGAHRRAYGTLHRRWTTLGGSYGNRERCRPATAVAQV